MGKKMDKDFILASQSPQRRALLEQIDYKPRFIEPANIDEKPFVGEKPSAYVKRMAREKALFVANKNRGKIVLASDTVIVSGTKIIQKSETDEDQIRVMKMLSGKAHSVLTGICVVDKKGSVSVKLNVTKIKMKKLTQKEIKDYVASKEWYGCAGYKIEGLLGGFVKQIIGSYSGVVGLPLYEARNLLMGAGVN